MTTSIEPYDDAGYGLPTAQIALGEMRLLFERKSQASDALTTGSQFLLGAAGVALALVGALPGAPTDPFIKFFFVVGLAAAFLLYILMLGEILSVGRPRIYPQPLKADWTVLKDHVMNQPELGATLRLVKGYADCANQTEELNRAKASHLLRAMKYLAIIVFLLLFVRVVAAFG